MAIVTYDGHCNRAKKFYNQDDMYFVIGGTLPWTDEEVPDPETEDEVISDPICYRKVEQKFYVVQDDAGTIVYRGKNFRIVQEADIYDERCRWVLLYSFLNYDEAPVGVGYRRIGLQTGVVPVEGVSTAKYTLLPNEVADAGILEAVANDTVTVRSANKREKLAILVEF